MRCGWLLVAAAVLLSSCMVGPKYKKPDVPVAPTYTEQPPQSYKETPGWKQSEPADQSLRADWWTIFGNPELNDLEGRINVSNQTLKAAEAAFRQARALIQVNRSNLYPTIGVGPSIGAGRLSGNRPNGPAVSSTYGDFVAPVDMSYEIDAWGRVRRSIAAAREQMQATAADLETVRLSLHAELAVDYFELRSLDAEKQLLDQTLVAYQKALDLTRNRFTGGLSSAAEVAQAETQLETTRAQDIDVGVARTQFEHAIAVLTGTTPESLTLAPKPLATTPPVIPVGLPSQLLERRPDIASAERHVAEANEQIGIAHAAFFPRLLITAAGGFEGGSIVNWFNWPSRFWAIGPSAVQTIFDAGRRRATESAATAGYDTSVANYRQTALDAFREVEDNLAALRILEQEDQTQRAAVAAAERSLNLAMNRYRGGLVTYLEVATAQTIALQNERTQVDLLRRRMDASVMLIKALGGGWNVASLPTD